MPMVSEDVLNEIRARVDIGDLIGARMSLKRAGGTLKGCCPFHKEKTPSFVVSTARQRYHCFGCGEDGDVFSFLMKHDGLTFMDAVRQLAEKVGVTVSVETDANEGRRNKLHAIYEELATFYEKCYATTREAQIAREYIARRQLPDEVVKLFRIGYAPRRKDVLLEWAKKHGYTPQELIEAGLLVAPSREGSTDYYDRFQGRLMFPICDQLGKVCAFSARILDKSHPAKYVNSPETLIFTKGRVLYALDKARDKIVRDARREALVCEGQIDVIRCHAAGFATAVAAQGTAFTEQHVDLLKRYADSVVLVFDADAAGAKAAVRTGALFLAKEIPVRVAVLPEGEDPDSFILNKGSARFQVCLDGAESLIAFQVAHLKKIEARPDDIDAVKRISRAVIESLLACPNAVMRAHLLQEAAGLLSLPAEALQQDMETARALAERKAAYAVPAGGAGAGSDDGADPDELPPLDDGGPVFDDEADLDEVPVEPGEAILARHIRLYESLLELLLHHPLNVTLRNLICEYLPPDIIQDLHTRLFVQSIFDNPGHGGPLIIPSVPGDPSFAEHVDALRSRDDRVIDSGDVTPEDAVQDLIRRLWLIHFEAERTAATDVRRRMELTTVIKALQTASEWKVVSKLLCFKPEVPKAEPRTPVKETQEASADYTTVTEVEEIEAEFEPDGTEALPD